VGLTPLLAVLATATHAQQPAGAAWLIRSLDSPADSRESRPDVLDAPILPGSLMKAVTLVAALESGVVAADTSRMCRRSVTVGGRRYTCSHPDLKRPLTPAEALAHSCNDFFVSLASRLARTKVNEVRARVGLPPVAAAADFAASLVGLDGPRVTPRRLLDAFTRLIGGPPSLARRSEATAKAGGPTANGPMWGPPSGGPARTGLMWGPPLGDPTRTGLMWGPPLGGPSVVQARQVLLEGLRGAATYGSASELASRQIPALAKTGTASMPGGGSLGVLIAFTPADAPNRALIVVAPGAAGRDATSIAGDLLAPAEGSVRVGLTTAEGKTRVETLPLDDYVARVVAGEGQPRDSEAAQQALAIAARTFTLANRDRHQSEGFDMCDTTHCQAIRPPTPLTRRVAAATTGRVLMDRGRPASIYYSAWCGGHSALPSNVWPGAHDHPYDRAGRDDACAGEPEWKSEVTASDIERALRAAGLKGDRLRDLHIVGRNTSGKVVRLRADGFTPAELSAEDFRTALGRVAGWQLLKSTMFEMRRSPRGYTFNGRGSGHGVGMCVLGAGRRAARGATADEILSFYYPGLRVEHYRPAGVQDLELALPVSEEGERTLVSELVRRARDEMTARAGVPAARSIRLTVYPDVESFGRATGQPWWTSGATDGASIALLPVTMLKQRGRLERTIRHEVTHVLLDGSLASKPMWVREGAASYFAGSPSGPIAPAGTTCPTDGELRKPTSADALRDAYQRAEACFRRQLAAGKAWRHVR
jgi:stage II sporulation protein D